jgi:RNA-directed DNA polymerase
MKFPREEERPAAVPSTAKQAGEDRARWAWTEPTVWTEKMLTALEEGVKGGVWFSLIDKVYRPSTLEAAFRKVKANRGAAGVDRQTIESYEARLEENLSEVSLALRENRYQPQAIRRVWIPKPGSAEKRPLGIPTVRDRVVQTALRAVLEPIFERDFAEHSYGFRPNRGCKDALRQVDNLLKTGDTMVVDADLKGYFDSIPKDRLMERVKAKIADGRVLSLIEAFLNQKVMDDLEVWTPETGTPQGAIISPLLANLYLDPLDHIMADQGFKMIRYADDFVILCRDQAEAEAALSLVRKWTSQEGLILHPEKTKTVDATQPGGFDFLGYHFERGKRWPRKKSLRKLKDAIREKTKRTNGNSLSVIVSGVNRTLIGWFEYFKHSHKSTFRRIDAWIRMRLRSILRKRLGRKGRGRGADHQRWKNSFFAALGLFSLVEAHAVACQSARR